MIISVSIGLRFHSNEQSRIFMNIITSTSIIHYDSYSMSHTVWLILYNKNNFVLRQRIFNEDQILAELNPILYEEVVTCGIINYIKDCEFFRTCREELQRKLCHLFKVEMYQPYTNIVMAGRVAQSFAIIRAGVVACENEELSRYE